MQIRAEQAVDQASVYAVNATAFESDAEARLVDVLRARASPVVSLVAEHNGVIVGHILFSSVSLPTDPALKIMGLGPMAVLPRHQRQGVGSALIRTGLEQCRQQGVAAAVVLGHPEYYPRFGFVPSSQFNIDSEYAVAEDVFMAMELLPQALQGQSGRVKYHDAFNAL